MTRVRSLQDLKQVQAAIAARRQRDAEREAARREAERRERAEQELFQRAVGAVQPIRKPARVPLASPQPAPVAVQQQRDERQVLAESLSDEFDPGTLLEVDDQLSFRRVGIGVDVTRKLRRGHWSIQRELDLHGLRRDDAREALGQFLRDAQRQGLRCVRIVHGKGLGSPGKTPVLKGKVHSWLVQKDEVLAFVQARADEGGAGAVVVLLKPAG